MKKRILPAVFLGFWMLLLITLGCYYLLFAPRGSEYSPTENRTLAGFPEISFENVFSGKFGTDFESYLLDRFPARNAMVTFTSKIESLLSLASHEEFLLIAPETDDPLDNDDVSVNLDDLLAGLDKSEPDKSESVTTSDNEDDSGLSDVSDEVSENIEDPPITPKPPVKLDDFPNYLGTYMDNGNGPFAVKSYAKNNVAAVTAVLNKYAKLLPENGKLMFTMVPQSRYANQFVNASNKNSFYGDWDDLVNGLGVDNVYAFDASEILSGAIKNGEYVYFRTDMHWNPYGTYLVYSEMVEKAGKVPCDYEKDFIHSVEEPFRGTYYRDNPSAYIGVEPDSLELLMPDFPLEWRRIVSGDQYTLIDFLDYNARANDRYTVYLGGPAGPWTYAECENGETENCLVITDSFGLSFVPLLTTNYKQVHYYDARYFDYNKVGATVSEMMEKYNIQDIYVVVGDLHSFDSNFIVSMVNSQLGVN